MSRRRLVILAGVLLLAVILAGGVLFLLYSGQGLRWAFARFAPAALSVKTLQGRLAGPISMGGITYRSKGGARIRIASLEIDWSPIAIFNGRLHITRLNARNIEVEAATKAVKPPSAKRLPEIHLPPIQVILDNAAAENIIYVRPAPQKPAAINRLALSAYTEGDTLHIRSLEAQAPEYSLAARGRIKPLGPYPLSLKVTWGFTPEGYPRAEGAGTLDGNLERLRVAQTLKPPYNAAIGLTIAGLLKEPEWKGGIKIKDLSSRNIKPSFPPLTLSAAIKGKGTMAAFDLSGSFSAFDPRYLHEVLGAFSLSRVEERVNIHDLVLSLPASNARVELAGEVSRQGNRIWSNIKGDWRALQWPLTGVPVANSPKGEFTFMGCPDRYRFSIGAELATKKFPVSRIQAEGSGNMKGALLEGVRGKLLGGEVSGRGRLAWRPAISWALSLSGKGLDPGTLYPEWKGSIGFKAAASGSMATGKRDVSIHLLALNGKLRGYPVGGSGRVRIRGGEYFIPGIRLHSGSATLSASGKLTREWGLSWGMNARRIGDLVPGAKGSLSAQGTVAGLRKKPVVTARISGKDARYETYGAKALQSALKIDLSDRQRSTINVSATGLTYKGHGARSVQLDASGRLSSNRIVLTARGQRASLVLALEGGYAKGVWDGKLLRMVLAEPGYGTWRLSSPTGLTLSRGQVLTGNVCLSNGTAGACLKAGWRKPTGAHVQMSASRIPLGLLQPVLPPGFSLAGLLNGNANLFYAPGRAITGEADFKASNGAFAYRLGQKRIRLSFREGVIALEGAAKAVRVRIGMPFVEGGGISGRLVISPPSGGITGASGISGNFRVEIPDLAVLAAVLPTLTDTRGIFRADFDISGTLRNPGITGKLAVENASATVPRLGITLADMDITAASMAKDRFDIQGSARSGKGAISLKGEAARSPRTGWSLDLAIKGRDFQAVRLPEAQAVAAPDLTLALALSGKEIHIKGQITVPQADIKPVTAAGAVKPSSDVVIVTRQGRKAVSVWKVYTDVTVILGDRISFSGHGLAGTITGRLAIHEEPGKVAAGRGELVIEQGKYKAYGQNLEIKDGRLLFSGGPVNNPGLNIRATRKAGEVLAGIDVTGTLRAPGVTVFSVPPMDQADALSYLVLGKPLRSASGAEGNTLYSAVTSLGLAGGEFLAKRIGSIFGIQQVTVEKAPEKVPGQETTTLFLGRYLSPRLYVGYGIGIFEPSSVFRVRYELTRKWMIQTESGTETGADMFFNLEWGK